MVLTHGNRLGPYEVLSAIGAGGMGEVYRARDARLNREVALKTLPGLFALDPDRLARFRREAQILASLSHPNIAAIYGLEESKGVQALVLELVEGPTVDQCLASGAIPVDEALRIARQIADALDAAHEHGIVHRDLKPANVKVRADGTVKVLDFGIAKALSPDPTAEAAREHATVTDPRMTTAGTILGTAAYMSPEQARGQIVDKRTDVWAFGCVLYEMLAGRTAFGRPTVTDTLAAVVQQPPDWTALPPATPPPVIRLLRRCLEKDARRRLRDIADARLDLEDADNPSPVEVVRRRVPPRMLWAMVAVSLLGAVGMAFWSFTRGGEVQTPDPVRFAIDLLPGEELPLDPGLPRPLAISRDGRRIVYVARGSSGTRIYLRRPDDPEATPIAGTEGGSAPFVSPDGEWLGFAARGGIWKVPIVGGTPQSVAIVSNVVGATWSDDGSIVFNTWESGLFRVSSDGGTPQPLTRREAEPGEGAHQVPYALPDGRTVAFAVSHGSQPPTLELADLSTSKRTRLFEGTDPHYLSSGHLLFTRAGRLHVIRFDLTRLASIGSATLVDDAMSVAVVQDRGALAAALDGTLAYILSPSTTSRLVLVDTDGAVRRVVDGPRSFSHPRLSPDGSRAVVRAGTQTDGELLVYDLERNSRVRLSVGGLVGRPVWSHDGKTIAFQKDGGSSIQSMPADDSRPPEILLARDHSGPVFPLAWSRDGKTFVYSRASPKTNRDVFTRTGGGALTGFLMTPSDERSAMLSPDGHWMVYSALEPGREEEVYVERYPDHGERVVVSVGGGREPIWSPSSGEIFYRSNDGLRMMSVSVQTEPRLSIGRPRTFFFQGFFLTGLFWAEYDVNPKTGEFLMLSVDAPPQPRVTVALNLNLTRPR